ncbi:MAG: zinc-binding alcohol dehydrogenase, partial [Flavobacteriaceae bacterium]|nr:zinc-binding alcohol dehydrogenase [Flavobacteriaceae bacterium]
MKQILQSFKTGITELAELPAPKVKSGQVLIKTTRSLVSLGTERMLVEFGKASLIQKARQQPDKVKMVLDKIKAEGLMPTLEAVFNKLEQPLPLGYCNVGKVIAVGKGVTDFKVGDRVASNGQHAEFVSVPQNLVAHIPDNVSDEAAAFTVIGSIGLQGIRLVQPTMGETIVVVGLGLIGLLTAEMLVANGCKVIGYDLDDKKVAIAKEKGIIAFNPLKGNDPVKFVLENTNNIGADGVIISASAKTNEIIAQTAQMSRKRGRIVLVGVIGLNISRADFYEKELSFQVSCSYGPGRYDDDYEFKGIDYPLPFVRWTEKRNFETVLQLISSDKLGVEELISEVVSLDDFEKIYGDIGNSKSIASIIKYDENSIPESTVKVTDKVIVNKSGSIGLIGAGNFTKMTLLPALKGSNAPIKHIVSSGGVNGTALAKKHGIAQSTTDYDVVLDDDDVS